jgi:hypothetical protein
MSGQVLVFPGVMRGPTGDIVASACIASERRAKIFNIEGSGMPMGSMREARMRRLIAAAVVVVAMAAVATSAAAQARMTFKCHDAAAPVCDGRFVMNGNETFLLGVYDSGFAKAGWSTPPVDGWESALFTGSGRRSDNEYYRGLAGIPINVYLNYWQGLATLGQVQGLLDVLGKYGVMWFQTANCSVNGSYTRYSTGFTVDQDNGYFAQQLAKHPQMAGYYIMDECGDSSYGTNLVPETQYHHGLLKSPSYDPAAVNFAVPIARGYRHPRFWTSPPNGDPKATSAPTADLFGTDPYPMYGPEPKTGYQHFQVPDYIARLRDEVPTNKPIVGVLQFYSFGLGGRLPTRAEMRMHAYSAIVEGAQGLLWWDIGENGVRNRTPTSGAAKTRTVSEPPTAEAMQDLKELVIELDTLKPALLATPTPGALVDVTPRSATPREWRIAAVRGVLPLMTNIADLQWYQAELTALTAPTPDESLSPMLRQAVPQRSFIRTRVTVVNGTGYVIAYNYGNTAIKDVTFTWRSAPTSVDVVGENRKVTPVGATFTDDFEPYEAHVYIVR